jgi:hypothetical protein
VRTVTGVSKYVRLADRLTARGAGVVEMPFAQVDEFVTDGLPASAYRYRTW